MSRKQRDQGKQRDPNKQREHGKQRRPLVIGPEGASPFLRGMLTHSLLKKGLSFEEAYAVALAVRGAISKRTEIELDELRQIIQETIAEQLGPKRTKSLKESEPEDPLILQNGGTVPFSRGLLSQRIAGTGLDPRAAYEVAQDVWTKLRSRKKPDIPEAELAKLVRQLLVKRHGDDFGKRYDAMVNIDRSDKPIIVLIGGGTGSGKSTMATEIAYRLGIRKISSTDLIREIMRMLLSNEILPSIHSSSYNYESPRAPTASDPIIEGFREQVERVEVGIAASIRRAVAENFHLIVEGVHVVPPMLPALEFQEEAYIVRVILATFDRHLLESRFKQRHKESRNRDSRKYLESIDSISRIQEHILELADQYDVPIIKNVNFDETTTDLLRLITDELHRVSHPQENLS